MLSAGRGARRRRRRTSPRPPRAEPAEHPDDLAPAAEVVRAQSHRVRETAPFWQGVAHGVDNEVAAAVQEVRPRDRRAARRGLSGDTGRMAARSP
ncbi:MAG: hypothetical protein IPJ14_22890 [Kineosporiaceae bacterium]|nr:hypothetical protein [Kineosporiaceae bacterium]